MRDANEATLLFRRSLLGRVLVAGALLQALVGVGGATQLPVAFVSDTLSGSISVFKTDDNTVLGSVVVGALPGGIAVTPNRRFAYVTTVDPDGVAVVDTAALSVVQTISDVGSLPQAIAISPDGRFAYVVSRGDNSVAVLDTTTNAVVTAGIPVGSGPQAIAITPDGKRAYVVNSVSNDVTVISVDANVVGFKKVIATIPVDPVPVGVAITPNGDFAYVANSGSNTVSVIKTGQGSSKPDMVIRTIPVGSSPAAVAITNIPRRGPLAFVTNFGDNSISVINADAGSTGFNMVIDTIVGVGSAPAAIATTPKGDFAYVTNLVSNADGTVANGFVSIIDTATDAVLPVRLPVGMLPADIAIAQINPLRLPTPVGTPTETPTETPTQTSTATDTPTATPEATATPTDTPVIPTPTDTPAGVPTTTPTNTATNTPTNTPTNTGTLPPSVTPTRTATPQECPVGSGNFCASGTTCKAFSCYPSCPPPYSYALCCPTNAPCTSCAGDCNGDRKVSTAEYCQFTRIFNGTAPAPCKTPGFAAISTCYAADPNHNGVISQTEYNTDVSKYLFGCP